MFKQTHVEKRLPCSPSHRWVLLCFAQTSQLNIGQLWTTGLLGGRNSSLRWLLQVPWCFFVFPRLENKKNSHCPSTTYPRLPRSNGQNRVDVVAWILQQGSAGGLPPLRSLGSLWWRNAPSPRLCWRTWSPWSFLDEFPWDFPHRSHETRAEQKPKGSSNSTSWPRGYLILIFDMA